MGTGIHTKYCKAGNICQEKAFFTDFAMVTSTVLVKLYSTEYQRNRLDCIAHSGCECTHPRKLNPQNGKD